MALAVRARRQRSARVRPTSVGRPHTVYTDGESSLGVSLRGGGPIEELAVPSGTTVEEHDLVTDGDVLVGSQSTVEFGLRGRNVALGERVSVENDIEAEGDCRLDTWCSVDGNVLVGEDAYLGERVTVTGRLMVSGDLDIGDDVTIEEGFEANGWIVIRNPVPTLVFYFIVSLSSCGSARPTRPTTWRRRSPTAKTCVTPAGPA